LQGAFALLVYGFPFFTTNLRVFYPYGFRNRGGTWAGHGNNFIIRCFVFFASAGHEKIVKAILKQTIEILNNQG